MDEAMDPVVPKPTLNCSLTNANLYQEIVCGMMTVEEWGRGKRIIAS
jgi:hypothetical protein